MKRWCYAPYERRVFGYQRVAAVALVAMVFVVPSAFAQSAPQATSTVSSKAEAHAHFEEAKALYRQGAYREALAELEAARQLDPQAKELVFNVALVHEKLGELDNALSYLRQYASMNLTQAETDKAASTIHRLEGAKHEMPNAPSEEPSSQATKPQGTSSHDASSGPPARSEQPSSDGSTHGRMDLAHGRIDAATLVTSGAAVVALGAGAYFGVKALSDRPTGFVTGRMGSYADFQNRNDQAHREAVVADVCFGVGLAATALAAYLYFGRTKVVGETEHARLAATVGPGSGSVVVVGKF